MSRYTELDIALSASYREWLSSFIVPFVASRRLVFSHFKTEWTRRRMYHSIWSMFPTQPPHSPESFVTFMLDGALDLLDVTLQGWISTAVWNIAIIFTIHLLYSTSRAPGTFVHVRLPQRLCRLRCSLARWTRIGQISENLLKLGHISVEALYIFEKFHEEGMFTIGAAAGAKEVPCGDSRQWLSYAPMDAATVGDMLPQHFRFVSSLFHEEDGFSTAAIELAFTGWLTCISYPNYRSIIEVDPDVWHRGDDASAPLSGGIDDLLGSGSNTASRSEPGRAVSGSFAEAIHDAPRADVEYLEGMPSRPAPRPRRVVGSVTASRQAMDALRELEEMLMLVRADAPGDPEPDAAAASDPAPAAKKPPKHGMAASRSKAPTSSGAPLKRSIVSNGVGTSKRHKRAAVSTAASGEGGEEYLGSTAHTGTATAADNATTAGTAHSSSSSTEASAAYNESESSVFAAGLAALASLEALVGESSQRWG